MNKIDRLKYMLPYELDHRLFERGKWTEYYGGSWARHPSMRLNVRLVRDIRDVLLRRLPR